METTKVGDELASKLNPAIGTTTAICEVCALVHRHAVTYHHIQERWCSDEMSDWQTARLERREQLLERRIRELVESLPTVDGEPFSVLFTGDPRGFCVYIVPPGEWCAKLADDWGGRGVGAS